ncbi:efflux RND transporter periplasmic adaptor subunit [Brevifollis gellanilyticus]|uniref:efflux RND transporter periplasmic adaptor subunit n=1 Tax=Brevifollis gellanilyticus TaxID=748831 RepID=UPI0011BEA3DD|nr:efflux RND transporter periplasmic adaptor subunit [Brevifollis gellanilyticus]
MLFETIPPPLLPSRSLRWLSTLSLLGLSLTYLPAADAPVVAVVPVVKGVIYREVSFDAELRPYKEIELHARATGYLDKMLVDAGDVVKDGQLIAALDVPELKFDLQNAEATERRAKADMEKFTAAYEEAHLAITRLEAADKAQPNLIAKQDIDSARLQDQSARAALNSAKEEQNVAAATTARFQTMLDYTQISAPFAGVITRRYSDPGSLIQAGTSSGSSPLVRLSQVDKLRVAFPVSVSYVAGVKVGDEAEIRIPSLGKKFTAKISRVAQKVETATRTMEAQIDLENTDNSLIAGVYATVVLKIDRRNDALVLPIESVARDKGTSSVYLVTKENKIEAKNITVGTESPTHLEIKEGLAEGDLVMVGSRAQFSHGQSVQPKHVELPTLEKKEK